MWGELFDTFGKNNDKKLKTVSIKKVKADLRNITSKVEKLKVEKSIKKDIEFPFVLNEMQDIINEIDNIDKQTKPKISKKIESRINLKIIEELIEELKSELSKECIGLFFAENNTIRVLKSWNMEVYQTIKLSRILNDIDSLLISNKKTKINNFYLLDLEDDKLVFTVKLSSHQFVFLLNKTNTNLGYLINIIKPRIIKQYIKSLK